MSARNLPHPEPAVVCGAGDGQQTLERVFVLIAVRHLFQDDAGVCEEVLHLTRLCIVRDVDVEKCRSFAASAGDTITPAEALSVIKGICEQRIRPTN